MDDSVVALLYLRAVDQASAQIRAVGAEVKALGTEVEASSTKWSRAYGAVSKYSLLVGSIGLAAGGAAAVVAAKFQEVENAAENLGRVTRDQMEKVVVPAIMAISNATGYSSSELLKSFTTARQAGFSLADALKVTGDAADLARGSHLDLSTAVKVTETRLRAYGQGANYAGQATDQLSVLLQHTRFSGDQLSTVLGRLLPLAAGLDVPFTQVAGALMTLSQAGLPVRQSVAGITAVLNALNTPTKTQRTEADALGLSWQKLYATHGRSLEQTLQGIDAAARKNATSTQQYHQNLKALLGSQAAVTAFLEISKNGWEGLNKNTSAATNSAGTASRNLKSAMKDVAAELERDKTIIENLAIVLGQALLPAISQVLTQIAPLVSQIAAWAKAHQQVVTAIFSVVAAIGVLGVAMKIVGMIQGIIAATHLWTAAMWLLNAAMDANPIGLVIIAVAALVTAFILAYTHSARFRQIVQSLLEALGELAQAIQNKVVGSFNALVQVAQFLGNKLDGLAHMLGITKGDFVLLLGPVGLFIFALEHVGQIVKTVGDLIGWLSGIIGGFLSALAKAASNVPILGAMFGAMIDPIKQDANAFAALGASIDSYAASGTKSTAVTDRMITKQKELEASSNSMATKVNAATSKVSAGYDAMKAHSQSAVDAMVAQADRLTAAWQKAGKQIAAAGLAFAASSLAGAHAQGGAAASQTRQQFSAAANIHVQAPSVTVAGQTANQNISYQNFRDQDAARAQATGSNAQVLTNAGMGGGVSGLNQAIAGFANAVDKLPPQFQAALSPVIQQYRAQIDALEKQYANDVRSEDQRHIAALQAIQRQHEAAINAAQAKANQQYDAAKSSYQAALNKHAAVVGASLQAHATRLGQVISQHAQAIKNDGNAHAQKLKSLHDAYLAKLDSIHGKNAAQRRAEADKNYQRQVAASNTNYQKKIQAQQNAITAAAQAYDKYLASLKTGNASYIAAQKKIYDDHVKAIQGTLNTSVNKANAAAAAAQAKEDALHTKHVNALKAAFDGHVAGLKKALKEASTPTGLINALSTKLQKDYDAAINKATLDELEHGKVTQKDIDAVQAAAAAQKVLTDAAWKAAFATGDLATKQQMLSQLFAGMISRASTLSQISQSEQAGQSQILAEKATAALDELKAIQTAIDAQTAVLQAQTEVDKADSASLIAAVDGQTALLQSQAGVDQATSNAQLAEIKSQGAIIQAQGAIANQQAAGAMAVAQAQAAVAGAKSDADRAILQQIVVLTQQKAAAEMAVARDSLRLAQDQRAADQSQAQYEVAIARAQLTLTQTQTAATLEAARWAQVLARDQLAIAQLQQKASAEAAAWAAQIDQTKILLAQAQLVLTQAQNRLALDQLTVLTDISTLLQDYTGEQIGSYEKMLGVDLAGIQRAQEKVAGITTTLADQQNQAAIVAQQWANQIAAAQQQLVTDQNAAAAAASAWAQKIADNQQDIAQLTVAKNADNQQWQIRLAQDSNTIALDQNAATNASNALQAENNALQAQGNANTSQIDQTLQKQLDEAASLNQDLLNEIALLRKGSTFNFSGGPGGPFVPWLNRANAEAGANGG